jgi:hypothetical protein
MLVGLSFRDVTFFTASKVAEMLFIFTLTHSSAPYVEHTNVDEECEHPLQEDANHLPVVL